MSWWMLYLCANVLSFPLVMWWLTRRNRLHATRLETPAAPLATPRVSLLIPARNEADNLRETLPLWLASLYPELEIIILDDQSDDETPALLLTAQREHPERFHFLHGRPLPEGWNGKNWACHQLSQAATGDILLFCDADVRVGPMAVTHTVSQLQHTGAGALTVVPHQQMKSWSEKAIVPLVMQVPTLSFVSLPFTFQSPSETFTVANGQWLAFPREVYDSFGGHTSARAAIVEDMELCRQVKRQGRRVLTVLATTQLSVRMYDSLSGVREGFSKNLFALMHYRFHNFLIVLFFFMLAGVLPWVLPLWLGGIWWLPLGTLLLARLELAALTEQPATSILWHPLGTLLVLGIALESLLRTFSNQLHWKGRRLLRPQGE
jgi:chlorobactene glucosyltransferase